MSTAILGGASTKVAGPVKRLTEMAWNLYSSGWYFGLLWLLQMEIVEIPGLLLPNNPFQG